MESPMPGPGTYFYGDEERKEVEDDICAGYLSRFGKEEELIRSVKAIVD
jgi:hypothetical protein